MELELELELERRQGQGKTKGAAGGKLRDGLARDGWSQRGKIMDFPECLCVGGSSTGAGVNWAVGGGTAVEGRGWP
jgi:hypothetical protein